MKKAILYIGILAAGLTGCSDEKDIITNNVEPNAAVLKSDRLKGEIPEDRQVNSVLANPDDFSLSDLDKLYKENVPDVDDNLKNMWLGFINPRLLKEGTEEQKLYYISEQLALENSLADFSGFYNLLRSSKKINREEKDRLADAFYSKNLKVIEAIQWKDAKSKQAKQTELVYAKRIYGLFANQE